MNKTLFLLAAFALPLGGCATMAGDSTIEPTADNGGKCNAAGLESFVGKEATVELGTDAVKKSGAMRMRWIPPRTAVTMDYREDRLNISYDDNMIVTLVNCG